MALLPALTLARPYSYLADFCVLENQRSEPTPGRGGTLNSSLYAADYDNEDLCEAAIINGGYVTRDEVFERMSYLLKRIVPVVERCKVQLCCHLSDPPAPVLRGVERWGEHSALLFIVVLLLFYCCLLLFIDLVKALTVVYCYTVVYIDLIISLVSRCADF